MTGFCVLASGWMLAADWLSNETLSAVMRRLSLPVCDVALCCVSCSMACRSSKGETEGE